MSERRRLFGPANTIIPSSTTTNVTQELRAPAKRAADEVRKFFVKTGVSENASGSCYLEAGNTIIEVTIFGPRPIRGSFIERASFAVSTKFLPHIHQPNNAIFNTTQSTGKSNAAPRTGLSNIEQKISSYVETSLLPSIILEKYPKSTIDCFISVIALDDFSEDNQVVNNGPILNLVSWIINCASLALVDSGIELRDIVTSGHVKFNEEQITYDPASHTENSVDCLVSYMNLRNDEIVGLWIEGEQDVDEKKLDTLIDSCNEVSKKIRSNVNSYLLLTVENI